MVDIGDGDGDQKELEGLRESVKELSAQNARLQTELNEAKLSEFEATEQVVNLTQVSFYHLLSVICYAAKESSMIHV